MRVDGDGDGDGNGALKEVGVDSMINATVMSQVSTLQSYSLLLSLKPESIKVTLTYVITSSLLKHLVVVIEYVMTTEICIVRCLSICEAKFEILKFGLGHLVETRATR